MREDIKDSRNQRIGYIDKQLNGKITVYDKSHNRIGEIKPEGKRLVAYNKNFQRMAYWDESSDYTYDSSNRRLSKGNILVTLYFQS